MRTMKIYIDGEFRPYWIVGRVFGEEAITALKSGVLNSKRGVCTKTMNDGDGKTHTLRAKMVTERVRRNRTTSDIADGMRAAMLY